MSNNNQWINTRTGKVIVFIIFSILMPIAAIVGICISSILIKQGNKGFIALLVFSCLTLLLNIIDDILVGKNDSAGSLRCFGILSIFTIGALIPGICMIFLADYVGYDVDDNELDDANNKDVIDDGLETKPDSFDDNKDPYDLDNHKYVKVIWGSKTISINPKSVITSWGYVPGNKQLTLKIDGQLITIKGISQSFIDEKWRNMSEKKQTKYFWDHWSKNDWTI